MGPLGLYKAFDRFVKLIEKLHDNVLPGDSFVILFALTGPFESSVSLWLGIHVLYWSASRRSFEAQALICYELEHQREKNIFDLYVHFAKSLFLKESFEFL